MSDYEVGSAIREGSRTIARALEGQRPKLVVVPLVFSMNHPLTNEQASQMAQALKHAFEEALK